MDGSKNEVKTKVKDFIVSTFLINNPAIVITDDDSFLEKGIVDSTGVLEVINFLQDTFSIEIKDDEVMPDNLDSLNHIADYILRKKAEA